MKIHPKAVDNFNKEAINLLSLVKEIKYTKRDITSFNPEFHAVPTIADKDIIGDFKISQINASGRQCSFSFNYNNKLLGINDEDYKHINNLTEDIYKIQDINCKVTFKFIEKYICDWVEKTFIKAENKYFFNFFLDNLKQQVKPIIVCIPINYLYIENSFKLGKVTLKPITKKMVDGLFDPNHKNKKMLVDIIENNIRKYQGHTVSTLSIEAEVSKAEEIALEETEKSLAILRYFSAGSLDPDVINSIAIWGNENIKKIDNLIFIEGKFSQFNSRVDGKPPRSEIFDHSLIEHTLKTGLSTLSNYLSLEKRNDFQESIINSVNLYSRSSTSYNHSDKLVYIIVALESIFLKNNSEPIQQNLSERIAILIGENLSERKIIIKHIKEAYDLRSKYVHHGSNPKDQLNMRKFMWYAWMAMNKVIALSSKYESKNKFIENLDDEKLSKK